jgi:pyridoxal phosphate enzyme (YggS family)
MLSIEKKLQLINENLDSAISTGQVELIAVTKYARDDQMIEAYQAGLRDFGENYVQNAIKKQADLEKIFQNEAVRWHLLGRLQSNKINKVVGFFETIQSVHSFELAESIDKRAQELGILQKIFLQLNMTGDKNGLSPDKCITEALKIAKLRNLKLEGLMIMGYHNISKNTETIYDETRHLKRILESELDSLGMSRNLKLSMGMSNDYRVAVKHGSSMIRLGRELFA